MRVALLITGGDIYRTVTVDYHGGPRYPQPYCVPGTHDYFREIAKPL